jgi:hypothetical protein
MPLHVASRRRTTLSRDFPNAMILDVTSRASEPWVRLSPFYPHGGIPCQAIRIEPHSPSKASGRR